MKSLFFLETCAAFKFFVTVLAVTVFADSLNASDGNNHELWYTYPARYWNSQALHLGNGFMGVSFHGGVNVEKFSITEKSIWRGKPAEGDWEKAGVNPRGKDSLNRIRDAVVNGHSQLADQLIAENVFGSNDYFGNFSSIGDLMIGFAHDEGEVKNYRRRLDLANSIGSVVYEWNDIQFQREYFCSYPDKLLAIRLTSSQKASISFDIKSRVVQETFQVSISKNEYLLQGEVDGNARPFVVRLRAYPQGGEIVHSENILSVEEADEVILLLSIETDYKLEYPTYRGEDPLAKSEEVLNNAEDLGYEKLKSRHVDDYRELYHRVSIDLNGDNSLESLPTNMRFNQMRSGSGDLGYYELAYNLGKYMIISSSRPGSLPANLQGVWNTFNVAPWAGNYQSNINIQEIYWSCGSMDIDECHEPYIDWIQDLAHSGREVSKKLYGTNGWVSHTTGNIWGHAAPIGNHPWGMYPVGAAWHCQHVWDYYLFTQDRDYLKNTAYPLMKEASQFWIENLVEFNGYLISGITVSAEHGALMTPDGLNPAFHDLESDRYHYALPGVYQDVQMISQLFADTSEAARILGIEEFANELEVLRTKLLPPRIGKHGQLQEWYEDIDSPDCRHRHIAHLYAVCPGNRIHPTLSKKWSDAAKVSLNMRGDKRYLKQELASGGNWSRAHRMWCWARLMDGNRAFKILTEMLTEQGFENGLTFQHAEYHWERRDLYMEDDMYLHFQLDGSASVPGLIAEMLLQTHLGEIHLLPALPDDFRSGKISGLKGRGGVRVDLDWENSELKSAVIQIPVSNKGIKVRLKDQLLDLESENRIKIEFL